MVLNGLFMVFHGFISPFLAVIDPNSNDLVSGREDVAQRGRCGI